MLAAAMASIGCQQSRALDLPPLHPVQGVVKYRGQPASGFRVTFHPLSDIGALKFAPSAVTAADGSFKLRSYQPDDGAPAGEYAVTFEWPDHFIREDDPDPVPEVDQLRGAYSNPQASAHKVTVVEGSNQVPVIELN
jgi:hypothetical protein